MSVATGERERVRFDETPCDCECGCDEPIGERNIGWLPTLLCEDCAHWRCVEEDGERE